MKNRNTTKPKISKETEAILKRIVYTKEQGARGDALKILFQMRYGKEWKEYYPQMRASAS